MSFIKPWPYYKLLIEDDKSVHGGKNAEDVNKQHFVHNHIHFEILG